MDNKEPVTHEDHEDGDCCASKTVDMIISWRLGVSMSRASRMRKSATPRDYANGKDPYDIFVDALLDVLEENE